MTALAYSPAAAVETKSQKITPKQEITAEILGNFVSWIDRSEGTTRTYLINLKQFAEWMQATNTSRPERADIIAYRDYLTAKGCKPSTINAYLRSVKQFFKWAAANDIYPDVAATVRAPKVDHSTHKKDALTVQEVANIETSIADKAAQKTEAAAEAAKDREGRMQRSTEQGKRLFAMYLLAVNAGLRTIELHRANIKDIETKNGQTWLYIWGKGHTAPDQKKALAPEVAVALEDYIESRTDHPTGSSPLFVSTGNRSHGKRIATTTISTMLKKAMQEAGYNSERLTAHSLRHTAGTTAMEATGDLYAVQNYMRHSNPATTEIYLHIETDQQDANIAKQLYSLYHGGGQLDNDSSRAKLERSCQKLTQAQLEQLANIAAAMAG